MNSTDEYVCVLNEMAKSICDVKHGGGFVDENALDLWEIISPRIRKKTNKSWTRKMGDKKIYG